MEIDDRSGAGLRLADDLALPLDAVTETIAILAKRGVGKTHNASVLAEELLGAGQQVVILDPLDVWWGLRAAADGEHPGLPIVVAGGTHGDVPLEPGAGALLADVVVETGIPIVLSLRHLSKGKQQQFVTTFAERLYARKGEPAHQSPTMIIIDECDAYVPQRVQADQARMVGAIDDLVRRGRSSGIGVTLISQRAAVVNKDVLSQCEILVALRTVSPQDRKALEAWIEAHDAGGQRAAFLGSLASLAIGEAWVWSPGWLDLFRRVQFRRRETFDSSATPKVGERRVAPRLLADVDLAALRERIAATVERGAADDPAALRARIGDLERQVRAKAPAAAPAPEVRVERVEVPVVPRGLLDKLHQHEATLARWLPIINNAATETGALIAALRELREGLEVPQPPAAPPPPAPSVPRTVDTAPPVNRPAPRKASGAPLSGGERRILTVLAQYPRGRSRVQVAILAGYSAGGGSYGALLSGLRGRGLLAGTDPLTITEAGRTALGHWEPLPTGRALLDHWTARLPTMQRTILDYLARIYPQSAARDRLALATGYEATGGSFGAALSRLKALDLIEQQGGRLRASAAFAEEG